MSDYHTSVLPKEIVESLNPTKGKRFIDATFGGGGHTRLLLEKGATVLGIDQDKDAFNQSRILFQQYPKTLFFSEGNFSYLSSLAKKAEFENIDGILMDLGVSSWQFDQPQRGFSFRHDAILDMRMNQDLNVKASDLLMVLHVSELEKLFKIYGDEPRAKAIAHEIVEKRKTNPIQTTTQLANLIEKIYRHRTHSKIHPATKVFQALRIAVNDELNSLKTALPQAISLLKPNGRLSVISFHEGEDRIVKHLFKDLESENKIKLITQKPITPTEEEISQNPRSRSAKLRVIEKK